MSSTTLFANFELAVDQYITKSPELWTQLLEFGEIRHLKKNEYLLEAGQVCQHGYFINSGCLIKTFLNQNGNEIVMGFYIDKDYAFLTEVTSYLSMQPSYFQIKAIEDCELLVFSESQLNYLIDNFQQFASFYHKITASSFQNLYMFSAMRLSLSAEEFLLFLYNEHPIYMQRVPDKFIAQFMGVSKEWFSKLKKKIFSTHSPKG